MESMDIGDEWLSQILGESTKKAYRRQLGYFMEFMGVNSVEQLIKLRGKERNFETRIIQFYQWLQKEKALSSNSARASCIPLQSLFSYVGAPLKVKNKLPRMSMKLESWKPSILDLQKIYKLGDISVKSWMSLSRDCPARMGDLLRITSELVMQGEFLLLSRKENVTGKVYISEETKTLFQQLKKANIELPKTQRGIDKMMETACRVGGLDRRINQHLFRKLWISLAINLGIPEVVYKILSFKSVPQELLTYYLDREELRTYWKKVVDALPLEPLAANGRIGDLQKEADELKSVMKVLAKFVVAEMKKENMDRKYKHPPTRFNDLKTLEDYLEKNRND